MGDYKVIAIEKKGHVAWLWLNNPDKLNVMGKPFWTDFPLAVRELADDPEVWVVVVAAKGRAFSAGLDLKTMGSISAGAEGMLAGRDKLLEEIMHLQEAFTMIEDCPKPFIAAVHGFCIGGGLDLMATCDIRLASADAVISLREARMAIVADLGSLQRLPAIIGKGHLRELAFTGKDIDAARAKEIQLLNEVYPDQNALYAAADKLAGEIANNSPLVVQGIKRILKFGEGKSVKDALQFVATWNSSFLVSEDLIEAFQAFAQKRPAEFKGR
ncbi:MAG: crotonase/enoyl-CoA hydratase family protein [bacterium]|nr:crotonase/enoyl-CoA hydratase family protein [bacterium]